MSGGLPISTPTALEIVESGAERFAVLAAAGTSSLTVLQISASGEMTPVDHINGDLHTRIQSVVALETVSFADRHFVIAGGANDGISLFQMLPDGRLYHLDAQEDLLGASLSNVTSISAQVRGSGLDIYVGSENEAGITQLRYELGAQALSQRASDDGELLNGGNVADFLIGQEGNDTINGGNGADIILDGAGSDVMTGGAGADVFILARDGVRDDILDFDPSQDRIDLSGWGRLYDVSGLTWSERSFGAVISYGDELLAIRTADGSRIKSTDIAAQDMFNLTHTDLDYMIGGSDPLADLTKSGNFEGSAGADMLVGTASDDVMRGNLGDDTLTGGAGDDTIEGGAGADTLDGGEGNDRLDGGQGRDILTGGNGNDILFGRAGDDQLFGGAGNDELRGNAGNDYLYGGAGSNTLFGGNGDDVFAFNGDDVGNGFNLVRDYEAGDTVELFNTVDADVVFEQVGNSTLLSVDGNFVALFENTDANDIVWSTVAPAG
mgnify:CR=1 FL=1